MRSRGADAGVVEYLCGRGTNQFARIGHRSGVDLPGVAAIRKRDVRTGNPPCRTTTGDLRSEPERLAVEPGSRDVGVIACAEK